MNPIKITRRTLDYKFIQSYPSIAEAARHMIQLRDVGNSALTEKERVARVAGVLHNCLVGNTDKAYYYLWSYDG